MGGTNIFDCFLIKELKKRGVDVTVIVPDNIAKKSTLEVFRGYNIVSSENFLNKLLPREYSNLPFEQRPDRFFRYVQYILTTPLIVSRLKADLVIGRDIAALIPCLALNSKKRVGVMDELFSGFSVHRKKNIFEWISCHVTKFMDFLIARRIDLLYTGSETSREEFINIGCNPNKVKSIGAGVDTRLFKPSKPLKSVMEKYGITKADEVVLYEGGVKKFDGLQNLVNAAPRIIEEHPNVKFVIVGDGEYLQSIKSRVECVGLSDYFVYSGWVNQEKLVRIIALAKIGVVPSMNIRSTNMTIPWCLLDLMACGTPCVVSDLDAVREVVSHEETAILTNPEDEFRLADDINRLLEDDELRGRIQKKGLEVVSGYKWEKIIKKMVDSILESEKSSM